MKIEGSESIAAPRADAWRGLQDPEVLRACTPGVTRLEESAPDRFEATLELKLPAVQGRFDGQVEIVERVEPERMKLRIDARGGPGFVQGEAELHIDEGEGGCSVRYVADVQIGGQIARLGQRMVSGVTREMAGQFFEAFERSLTSDDGAALPAPRNPLLAFLQLAWRTLLNLLGLSRRS